MPICSSGISSDLSRPSAAVRAYVPSFLLFPSSSLSPPSLPRFSRHPSSVPFLCPLPLPFLPPAVHTSFLSPASLQQPPFSSASACPHCFISLQPPCLSLWFCSFGPSPPSSPAFASFFLSRSPPAFPAPLDSSGVTVRRMPNLRPESSVFLCVSEKIARSRGQFLDDLELL